MKSPIIIKIDATKGPNERQWVTIGVYVLVLILLYMVTYDPKLWDVELFKIIMQAVVLTAFINMVLAFHFAANKTDETAKANTGKAFDALQTLASNASDKADTPATGKPDDPVNVVQKE